MACPVSLQPRVYSLIWTWCDIVSVSFIAKFCMLPSQLYAVCLMKTNRQSSNLSGKPAHTFVVVVVAHCLLRLFFFKGRGEEKGDLTTKCEMGFKPMQLWLHEPAANRLKAPWQSSELCAHSFLFCPNPIWLWTFYFFIFLRPSTNGSPPNSHLRFSCLLIQAPSLRVANVTVQLWNMAVPMACVAVSHAGTWPIMALQCWQLQIKRKKRKGNIFPLLPAEKKKISFLCFMHSVFLCNLCKSWY